MPAIASRGLPGVRSAAFALDVPLGQVHYRNPVAVDGYTAAPDEDMALRFNVVSSGYFETLRVPIASGRAIDERDTRDSQPVVVVSEAFVKRYFGGGDAIGRSVSASTVAPGRSWASCVTVATIDSTNRTSRITACRPAQSELHPAPDSPGRTVGADRRRLAREVSRALDRIDPDLPIGRMLTGREFLSAAAPDYGRTGASGLGARLAGARAGNGRALRAGRLLGQPADEGVRCAHRARRQAVRRWRGSCSVTPPR